MSGNKILITTSSVEEQETNSKDKEAEARGTSFLSTKLYRRRWAILFLFSLYSGSNGFQWIQYGIINNIVSRFYGVEVTTVDWLSMVYMLAYIPLILPVTWLLDRKGLRVIALTGSSLNALGALIKIASADPSLFWVTMTGQTICSIAQVFILGMPSKIAATWFSGSEVSTACSIGVFGNQIGVAIAFLITPLIVPDDDDVFVVATNLRILFIGTAAVAVALAVLVVIIFKEKPPKPPSEAQLQFLQNHGSTSYAHSIKQLVFSPPSLLLIISYGINTGSYYAISTLLNQEILDSFPGKVLDAGFIGLIMMVAGVVGSILCGIWKTTVGVYVLTLIFMGLFTGILRTGYLWIVYIASGLLGFTMTGYLPVGFEFAAEITYPVSEGSSSGLLNASAQFFGMVFIISMGHLIPATSVLGANVFLCCALLIGSILTVSIKADLKRQRANQQEEKTYEKPFVQA